MDLDKRFIVFITAMAAIFIVIILVAVIYYIQRDSYTMATYFEVQAETGIQAFKDAFNITSKAQKTFREQKFENIEEYDTLSNYLDDFMAALDSHDYGKALDMLSDDYVKAENVSAAMLDALAQKWGNGKYPKVMNIKDYYKYGDNAFVCDVEIINDIAGEEESTAGDDEAIKATVVLKNDRKGGYKLQLNGFIATIIYNQTVKESDIVITVERADLYADKVMITVGITNNSNRPISLSPDNDGKDILLFTDDGMSAYPSNVSDVIGVLDLDAHSSVKTVIPFEGLNKMYRKLERLEFNSIKMFVDL